ncbi:MAG: hypothetical protein J0L92_16395 [Deltaproteobacteria bacterium]|nr:hypothetical protein [Deltaproteobacteria bacterium]
MSTKDLSRSVIEGGRRRWNTWTRRRSHRVVRAEERVLERRILARSADAEVEDVEAWPLVSRVPREFFDRLSAPERWLESQVGRSWNRVRSAMLARFDTRTLAGRHIVFDHLSPTQQWGEEPGVWQVERVRFRVDQRGILRRAPARIWPRLPLCADPEVIDAMSHFVGGRKLLLRGVHTYWLVPVERIEGIRYRQHRALTPEELSRWRSFPVEIQRLVLLLDPTDVSPDRGSVDRSAPRGAPHRGCRSAR